MFISDELVDHGLREVDSNVEARVGNAVVADEPLVPEKMSYVGEGVRVVLRGDGVDMEDIERVLLV